MASEFDLIRRHFRRPVGHTVLGVGDDCALIAPSPGMELAISTDMLVAGTHFLPDTDPESLGWKALAVNVSDLAAMGAQPRWALLAASVPEADDEWVEAFSRGFFACAGRFGLDLIGGDTTRGPLNLTPTVIGEVPAGAALRRSGARDGDDIWVSGAPGLAALGLAHVRGEQVLAPEHAGRCVAALERPQPRVDLGIGLRGLASAAIDVSDGLLADLAHVLEESAVAARLDDPRLPFAAAESCCSDADFARQCVLSGGDDYELAFTGPPRLRAAIEALGRRLSLELWRIGKIVAGTAGELTLIDADGRPVPIGRRGYDHFAA